MMAEGIALKKSHYRIAALALITTVDKGHKPYIRQKAADRSFSYTRNPAGCWVQAWVWVPKTYAMMQATKGESE